MAIKLKVNGSSRTVTAEPDTPLLYVLRNDFGLNAAKFGCGLAQCGACTVLVDGKPMRSCMTEISDVDQSEILTLEGLGTVEKPHPLQQAYVEEQVPQCGYCVNGWLMTAATFLKKNPKASDAEIRSALTGLKCRCGTHVAILRAIKRAQSTMA